MFSNNQQTTKVVSFKTALHHTSVVQYYSAAEDVLTGTKPSIFRTKMD